jgi:hypothetical protein
MISSILVEAASGVSHDGLITESLSMSFSVPLTPQALRLVGSELVNSLSNDREFVNAGMEGYSFNGLVLFSAIVTVGAISLVFNELGTIGLK